VDIPGWTSILVAPEDGWVQVNIAALAKDSPKTDVLEDRTKKELWRAFVMLFGGGNARFGKDLMRPVDSLADLDAFPNLVPGPEPFNAVLDGADAVMLSGESASGKYPIESINVQARIAKKAEEILDYERFASDFYESSNKSQGDAIGISVSKSCLMLDAKLVVIVSNSFTAARKLAKFKIKAPVLAVVKDKNLAISLNGLYYGITAIYDEREQDFTYEEKERLALDLAKRYGVKEQETIIFVSSNSKNNKSNAMKILQVE
jgi:pyruvate kinase